MKTQKFITLSTRHLHPLEADKLDEVSYLHSNFCNLICIEDSVIQSCKDNYLPCLADLLSILKHLHQIEWVMFDPEAEISDEIALKYDW